MTKLRKWAIFLTDDSFQLDRRIYHQACSLQEIGFQALIIYFHANLPLVSEFPVGVHFHNAAPATRLPLGLQRLFAPFFWLRGFLSSYSSIVRFYQFSVSFQNHFPTSISEITVEGFDNDAEIIIANDLPTLPLALELKAKFSARKVIFDAHEYYEDQLELLLSSRLRKSWRSVSRVYIPRADEVLTVTDDIAHRLTSSCELQSKVEIIPNAHPWVAKSALNSGKGKLRGLYNIPPDKKIILCSGGITRGRNLEDLILASRVLDEDIVVCFLGFSDKVYLRELVNMVTDLKLESKVKIGRSVQPDTVVEHCVDAELGFISNRGSGFNNTEGCPNRLYEYIQARLPIFSFRHKGISQVLEKTQTGFIREWSSPEELGALLNFAVDAGSYFAPQLFEEAAKTYSWESYQHRYQKLICR